MKKNKIILFRHGETDANKRKITQGQTINLPLNELGRTQARLLGRYLKGNFPPPDIIYSSGLIRSIETGIIVEFEIFSKHPLPFISEPALNEINYGDLEGKTSEELMRDYAELMHIWHTTPLKAEFPNGEKIIDARKRILAAWEKLLKENGGKNILVVGHGSTNRLTINSVSKKRSMQKIGQDNACLNVFEKRGDKLKIALLNFTGHLTNLG